jgi:hypothetical protein
MKLFQAAFIIEDMTKKEIELIEYEDGSGMKFNYRVKGETEKTFIDLSQIKYGTPEQLQDIIGRIETLRNIMGKM